MIHMQWLKLMRPPSIIAVLAIATFGVVETAGGNTLFAAKATVAPAIVTQLCAACHGREGNSADPRVSLLAGQVAPYLERQLAAFKAQRRTGVMGGVAMGLSRADMHAAACWFARQTPLPNPDPWADSAALAKGATIYREGIVAKKVPACAACHALRGGGLAPEFPRLAGQHSGYLRAQLRAFRSSSRLSNPNAMMRDISSHLSDSDIDAVTRYIADLQ